MMAPTRIVSLLAAATEMIEACGAGERLVGVSHECNFPQSVRALPRVTRSYINSSASSRHIDGQVKECVATGGPLYAVDRELLASLQPDLIVTQAQCDVCAVRYEDVVEAVAECAELGDVPIVALNPQSLSEILDDVLRVGSAVGCPGQAAEYVAGLRERIEFVGSRTHHLTDRERTRVAMIEWIDPPMLAANWTPELVTLAGGVCPLAVAGQHSAYLDWNELIEFDPEVVVVAACGFDLARTLAESRQLMSFDGWCEIAAVKNDRAFAVDGDAYFNRAGPRIVESLEILACLVRPELFGANSLKLPPESWAKIA